MTSPQVVGLLFAIQHIILVGAGTFSIYSETIKLRPGEVHNTWVKPMILPFDILARFRGKNLSVYKFEVDIVSEEGIFAERSIPLTEVYNHHYVLVGGTKEQINNLYAHFAHNQAHIHGCGAHEMNRMVRGQTGISVFGGGTGGEYRNFDFTLAAPYAVQMHNPEFFFFLPHFINLGGNTSLLECPCTSERRINVTNNSIDGHKIEDFDCDGELLAQKNPSCSLATYRGGLRCCWDGVFLTEKPDRSAPYKNLRAKLTVHYRDEAETTKQPPVGTHLARCCDVTGDKFHHGSIGVGAGGGNAEYDVPQCAAGTPPERCVHITTNVQTLDYEDTAGFDPDEILELVSAVGHMHFAGLGIDLYDDRTGQLLCHSTPRYGNGSETTIGNEAGMLVEINGCKWGPPPLQAPPRFRAADLVRTVTTYNSTSSHTGVMGLWLIQVAPVAGRSKGLPVEVQV